MILSLSTAGTYIQLPSYSRWMAITMACIATFSSFLCTYSSGILITYDSGVYAIGAKSLLNTGQYLNLYGSPNTVTPPLYSLILALNYYLGTDLSTYAKAVNLISYGFVVYAGTIYIYNSAIFYWLKLLGSIMLVLCTNMLMVSNFIWSESCFIVSQLSALYFLEHFHKHNRFKDGLFSIFLFAVGYFFRNLGLVGIIVWFTIVLIKIKYSKNYLLLISGLGIWMVAYLLWPTHQAYHSHEVLYTLPLDYNRFNVWASYLSILTDDLAPISILKDFKFISIIIFICIMVTYIYIFKMNAIAIYYIVYVLFLGSLYMFFIPYWPSDVHRYILPLSLIQVWIILLLLNRLIMYSPFILLGVSVYVCCYQIARYTKNWMLWHEYGVPTYRPIVEVNSNKKPYRYSTQAEIENIFETEMVLFPPESNEHQVP